MKTMKIFDCQSMPDDVRKVFFNETHDVDNDVYVSYDVGLIAYESESYSETEIIDKWLIENGAVNDEEVIIRRWW